MLRLGVLRTSMSLAWVSGWRGLPDLSGTGDNAGVF